MEISLDQKLELANYFTVTTITLDNMEIFYVVVHRKNFNTSSRVLLKFETICVDILIGQAKGLQNDTNIQWHLSLSLKKG